MAVEITDKNFNIRKMAEERATRRIKGLDKDNLQPKKSFMGKEKTFASKRQNKLTLSKALDEEAFDGKERSLSSVKRARLKAKKSQDYTKTNIEANKMTMKSIDIKRFIGLQKTAIFATSNP